MSILRQCVAIIEHLKYSPQNNKKKVVQKGISLINSAIISDSELANNSLFHNHSKVKYHWQQAYALYENCLMKNKHV